MEEAIFAGGCFWCTEAIFKGLKGVISVESGYCGGAAPHPTYQQVCSGETGHAEAIRIKFDPQVISYKQLLDVFWKTHDPTTLDRQGADVGSQYRSAIFYQSDSQKEQAILSKHQLEQEKYFTRPIITEITPATTFYPAEPYHHDYYQRNKLQPYCQVIIDPKLKKLQSTFGPLLK